MRANFKNILFFLVFCIAAHSKNQEHAHELNNYCRSQNIMYLEYMFTDFLGNTRSAVRPAQYAENDPAQVIPFDRSLILEEALEAYRQSNLFKELLRTKLFNDYYQEKSQKIDEFSKTISTWEFTHYF